MATLKRKYLTVAGTVASQRAQVQELHDLFIAAGWVQTEDSGQLEEPAAFLTNGTLGFRTYRWSDLMSDSLGSLYARVSFDVVRIADYFVAPFITLGSGTDGAGNLTGAVAEASKFNNQNTATYAVAGQNTSFVSAGEDYSLLLIGASFRLISNNIPYHSHFPEGYPALPNCLGFIAVRRLRDRHGNRTAGFSVLSTAAVATGTATNYATNLKSIRITPEAVSEWGPEMFVSYTQKTPLAPLSLTPAIQLTNPLCVSSDGALLPFEEVAFYLGNDTLTRESVFTNEIDGAQYPFMACGLTGVMQYLAGAYVSTNFNTANFDHFNRDHRSCLAIKWV